MSNNQSGIPCIVCGAKDFIYLYGQTLVKCTDCGYIWASTFLDRQGHQELYEDTYFFGGEYLDYIKEGEALERSFRRNLEILRTIVPSGRLLEIGSAYGFFLNLAKEIYEVEGVEINTKACQYAQDNFNVKTFCGEFLELDFPLKSYQLIIMTATLEHLIDPQKYIQKISQLLTDDGVFVCTIPDIGSLLARVQGAKWRQIHPPTHLNYFSEKTIKMLLKEYGFRNFKFFRLGEFRSISNVLYTILVLQAKLRWFYDFLRKIGIGKGFFYLNTFDTLFVVAKK